MFGIVDGLTTYEYKQTTRTRFEWDAGSYTVGKGGARSGAAGSGPDELVFWRIDQLGRAECVT